MNRFAGTQNAVIYTNFMKILTSVIKKKMIALHSTICLSTSNTYPTYYSNINVVNIYCLQFLLKQRALQLFYIHIDI